MIGQLHDVISADTDLRTQRVVRGVAVRTSVLSPSFAAAVAVATVREYAASSRDPAEVIFCCFSRADLRIYESLLQRDAAD